MEFILRSATHEDLPGILEIVNHAILHTTAIYDESPRTLHAQTEWFDQRKAAGFPVWVAAHDNEIAGFASYGTFKPRTGYRFTAEHSVYVRDGFHGNGIGKRLLDRLIESARSGGLHSLVGVIDASNQRSIAFHKRAGFETCGTIRQAGFKFGRWLDVCYMQLMLGPESVE
jgi:phosphinothricin acetyltransferase